MSRNMQLGRGVVFTLTLSALCAHTGLAVEFDYLNEAGISAEMVLEIKNGSVVYNVNETRGAEDSVRIPFRFFYDGLGFGNPPSIVFIDPSGAVTFADHCPVSPTITATLHAASNGTAYLKMEGPHSRLPGIDHNPYPAKKKFYDAEGELLWEKDIIGYPRVSPVGDYVGIFEVQGPESKITIIDRAGRETVIKAPCGQWHAVSQDGKYLLLGEPSYVPVDWPGGTTAFSKDGTLKARLDPLFICETTGMNLRGQTLYGSDKLIIQSGVYGHRVVHWEGEVWGVSDSPEFERGIQVYRANGTKLWEKNLGEGSDRELNFFVSGNEEFIAFFPGRLSGVTVLRAETGDVLYEFDAGIPGRVYDGFISDDGKTVLLTHVGGRHGAFESGVVLVREGVIAATAHAEPGDGRVTGRLSEDGTMLLVSEQDSAKVFLIGGGK
jgi:hypothetical protein